MTKIKLTKETWGPNRLKRRDSRMCCLGHYLVACGVEKGITGKGLPHEVRGVEKRLPEEASWLLRRSEFKSSPASTNDAMSLASANDRYFMKPQTPATRAGLKATIVKIFAKHRVIVTFGRGL